MNMQSRIQPGSDQDVNLTRKSIGRAAMTDEQFAESFWARVEKTDACWWWRGAVLLSGYGNAYRLGRQLRAHRVAFELSGNVIPDGLVLDHLCRNPLCVNPDHLEAVSHGENTRRGVIGELNTAKAAAQTHCKNGHEFTPENTYYSPSANYKKRSCRKCQSHRSIKYAALARAGQKQSRLMAEITRALAEYDISTVKRWLVGRYTVELQDGRFGVGGSVGEALKNAQDPNASNILKVLAA